MGKKGRIAMTPINFNARRAAVAVNVDAHGFDAYLATRQAALHYLCGVFIPWRGVALITARGDFRLFYWAGDAARVRAEGAPMEVTDYTYDDLIPKIKAELDRLGLSEGRLAVDLFHSGNAQPAPGILTAGEYLELKKAFPRARIDNGVEILDEILMIKAPEELERMRYVAEIADYGLTRALEEIRVGVTENHIAGVLEQATRDRGSYWAWSVTAGTEVGSGRRSSFPGGVTQIASEKKIGPDEFLILDFHPSWDLYLCDFSGPVFLGKPDKHQQKLIDCWEEAVATVFDAVTPGAVIGDAVKKGLAVYEKYGLSQYSLPRFGHGLGVCTRTGPLLNANNREVFQTGMAFAMGAHLYQPGVGGLRLEYPVAVGERRVNWPKPP